MKLLVAFFAFSIGALSCSAENQASFTLGLHDASGAPIANAKVSVVRNRRGWPPESVEARPASGKGRYSAAVVAGVYDVLVSAPCFVPLAVQVRLSAGDHAEISERMKFQSEEQADFISDGCQEPDLIPRSPMIDTEPMPLPDRIQPSPSEPQH